MNCLFDEPFKPYYCEADWNCIECLNWIDDNNNQYYFMACEYMAKTELYDRSLTNCRSPYDETEAFIDCNPRVKKLSNEYAAQLRRYYSKICGGTWQFIHNEIHKHTEYTAQMWINEYYRLKEVLEDEETD